MLLLKPFTEDHGRSRVRLAAPPCQFSCASWVFHPPTRIHVRLLGPCFKTGRLETFRQRPERADPRRVALRRALRSSHGPAVSLLDKEQVSPAGPSHADQAPALSFAARRPRIKPRATQSLQSLPPQQFQALFNSLFKGLFIFPSRYLFAIGLSPVFSLGRNLPPT